MGKRLTGFDYAQPYFYMVTLRRRKDAEALSQIEAPGHCRLNDITKAFVNSIRNFHFDCPNVAPIECFSIMPDHIHLLIKIITPTSSALRILRLETIVDLLMQALEGRYREVTGKRNLVFEASWHDWIVSREGQLAAFTRYIRENPKRSYLRKSHSEYFRRVNEIVFLGRKWYGYGNAALLQLPVIEPFRCSRKWQEGGTEWNEAINRAARIGPGGAGISTFMSPCEKACGHEIGLAGGRWIVLSPEGFSERWHPSREYERFCAEGRMLFLSLYSAMARDPSRSELYERCHEMGDIVVQALRARG